MEDRHLFSHPHYIIHGKFPFQLMEIVVYLWNMIIQNLAKEETEKAKVNLQIQHPYYNIIIAEHIFSSQDISFTCFLISILGFKKKNLLTST